jgi:hypothetical protein
VSYFVPQATTSAEVRPIASSSYETSEDAVRRYADPARPTSHSLTTAALRPTSNAKNARKGLKGRKG